MAIDQTLMLSTAGAALGELAKGAGCEVAMSHYGERGLTRSAMHDEYEFRIKLKPAYALGRISHEDFVDASDGGAEAFIAMLGSQVDRAAARLRAHVLMQILDNDKPLDFTDIEPSGPGLAAQHMERAAVRLMERAARALKAHK